MKRVLEMEKVCNRCNIYWLADGRADGGIRHVESIELYNIERQHTRGKPCPFEPANMAVGGGGSWGRAHFPLLFAMISIAVRPAIPLGLDGLG